MSSNTRSLVRDVLRDLVADVRSAERDGFPLYAAECRAKIHILFPQRHTARLDAYGWPICLKEFK